MNEKAVPAVAEAGALTEKCVAGSSAVNCSVVPPTMAKVPVKPGARLMKLKSPALNVVFANVASV